MTAKQMFDAAMASFEAARAQSRVELAASEARVARLRHAAELEKQGRYDEARPIIEAVRAVSGYWDHSAVCEPLTVASFHEGCRRMEEMSREPIVPEYKRAPHNPRCTAVRTQDWRDCDCSTSRWLAQFGYYTYLMSKAMTEWFRRHDAVRDHFAALDRDDD